MYLATSFPRNTLWPLQGKFFGNPYIALYSSQVLQQLVFRQNLLQRLYEDRSYSTLGNLCTCYSLLSGTSSSPWLNTKVLFLQHIFNSLDSLLRSHIPYLYTHKLRLIKTQLFENPSKHFLLYLRSASSNNNLIYKFLLT